MPRPEEMEPRGVSVASGSFARWRSRRGPAERKRSRPDAENGGAEVSSCSPMRPRPAKRGEGSRLDQQSRAGEGRHNLPLTPTLSPPWRVLKGVHARLRRAMDARKRAYGGAREHTELAARSLATHSQDVTAYSLLTAAALMIGLQRAI